ncbi:MAG: DUF1385 domain-containing protein [Anaerolineaceae bacterium]|nr:DUF1385 domain-containing protein [Anaerolineaceae bacterium]
MAEEKLKLPAYGGQALIEGVLMRGQYALAAAMRSPEGEIVVTTEELGGIYKSNIRKIPFLRGLIILWDAMGLGIRYLTASANLQSEEDEQIEGKELILSLLISLGLFVALFIAGPAFISGLFQNWFNWSPWWSNLAEGFFRLGMILLYIWGIGKMKDIKRVFTYHGAEHKTINAFEAGAELTPSEVKKYSLQHPRCGTSFILTLALISIIVFTLIGPLPLVWRVVNRILLIPVIAGISYEYTRWAANHLDSPFVRWLVKPNLAIQNLTTNEPDEKILEVSLAAFSAMLELEEEIKQRHQSETAQ